MVKSDNGFDDKALIIQLLYKRLQIIGTLVIIIGSNNNR